MFFSWRFARSPLSAPGSSAAPWPLPLKKHKFSGRIVGCDSPPVLERARDKGAIDTALSNPADAVQGSSVVVLATPVVAVIDLIERLGPALPAKTLLTDVASTKSEVVARAKTTFGKAAAQRFLPRTPDQRKGQIYGVVFADPDLFEGAAWFVHAVAQSGAPYSGLSGKLYEWVEKIGARIANLPPQEHDQLCAWISHLPQMISTALAASLGR